MKLYGYPISTALRRVAACLQEKELEYEFVLIDLPHGEHKKDHFLSLNPFGQVPALEDGDLTLFESRAINQHLARTYADKGTQLIPNDPKKLSIVSVWMEVESQQFDTSAAKLSYELVIKPLLKMNIDESVVQQNQEKLSKVIDVYEARLMGSKYLGGEEFSLADLNHLPVLNNLFKTRIKDMFDARPHVRAWCEDIMARPAWKKVVG